MSTIESRWRALTTAVLEIEIVPGHIHDYDALARHHYRAGRPATHVAVLVARGLGERLGVLVASMPTLNGSWRRAGFADFAAIDTRDKRSQARWLNQNLRCLSRVVIDPRVRGLGLAKMLVAAYLAEAPTRCTEAVAAMGHVCPFFAGAGMTPVPCRVSVADAALARRLEDLGVGAMDLIARHRRGMPRAAREAIMTWARSSRRVARIVRSAETPSVIEARLVRAAAITLASRPIAFVYPRGDDGGRQEAGVARDEVEAPRAHARGSLDARVA
jgi:GNAT superfamily N-acetyltransferase